MNIYAETVFNEISDDLLLFPLYFDDELCMEIETEEELEIAERYLYSYDEDAGYRNSNSVSPLPSSDG